MHAFALHQRRNRMNSFIDRPAMNLDPGRSFAFDHDTAPGPDLGRAVDSGSVFYSDSATESKPRRCAAAATRPHTEFDSAGLSLRGRYS
ncbi:hypothetical protein EVAR_13757_1 [Eumeta japonica]|uniref:Uncharacterized protein n=1 Tax=Eumeta variegata TaxID=151549 RepID=A0A4C1UBT6_EUMVA|nr:hypothetical protein EVAR_13757_1 [Eumeta japonica]